MMADSTPRERRQSATRQHIINTARRIILKKGLDGLSMRALADATDYSPSALYKYFASKDAILQAVRAEAISVMEAHSRIDVRPDATLPEQFYQSALRYLDFAEQYPEYYQLIFNSPVVIPRDMDTLTTADSSFAGLAAFIQHGVKAGVFALPEGYTVTMLAMQVWMMAHGMAMLRLTMMGGDNPDFDTLCRQMIRAHINTFTVKDRLTL